MANETYLPGSILSMPAAVADRLITAGNGDAALLYLHLLSTGGVYDQQAAKRLKWDAPRCDAAHALLVGMGLARPAQAPAAPVAPPAPEPPEYSAEDIRRELEDHASPFPALVQAVQGLLGKVLSTADLRTLYTIYDFSGLPPEVILLAVNRAIEDYRRKYGAGRVPRMSWVKSEVFHWKELGVDTAELAEEHLRRLDLLRDRTGQILALVGIRDRAAVAKEREYIESWIDMGFPDEVIRLAYEKTVFQKQSMSWPYMNSILKRWHQQGLHTLADVQSAETRRRPTRPAANGAGATLPQPGRPGEAEDRARADMERLRRRMEQEKREGK